MFGIRKETVEHLRQEYPIGCRVQLAKDGKIATVDGEPEEIHTFKKWRELGYTVLRGEKAICKLSIWKPVQRKGRKAEPEQDEDKKEPTPWMVPKTAFFFSRSQVDELVESWDYGV